MKMNLFGVLFLILFLLYQPGSPAAQTVSASGSQASRAMGDLSAKLTVLKQELAASQAAAAHLKTCMAGHSFYNPASSQADSNGCVYEQDPQVGQLSSNSLCTSDGSVVNCKPINSTDIKVFTITQISENHKTAVATCPGSSMRLSCAGTRSYIAGSLMQNDCTESTCGTLGIQPVGDNACRVSDGGTSSTPNPAAVAICLSLDGSGTNQVIGNPPCTTVTQTRTRSGGNCPTGTAALAPYNGNPAAWTQSATFQQACDGTWAQKTPWAPANNADPAACGTPTLTGTSLTVQNCTWAGVTNGSSPNCGYAPTSGSFKGKLTWGGHTININVVCRNQHTDMCLTSARYTIGGVTWAVQYDGSGRFAGDVYCPPRTRCTGAPGSARAFVGLAQ